MQHAQVVLGEDATVNQALQEADKAGVEDLLVRLNPTGWSSVKRQELRGLAAGDDGEVSLNSLLALPKVPFLHPDHPLEMALRYTDRWPLVPVVSRADFAKLEGVITQKEVLERYREFGEG
jgi:hypothetical protein